MALFIYHTAFGRKFACEIKQVTKIFRTYTEFSHRTGKTFVCSITTKIGDKSDIVRHYFESEDISCFGSYDGCANCCL